VPTTLNIGGQDVDQAEIDFVQLLQLFASQPSERLRLVIDGGRVTRIYAVRNPHKLGRLHEPAALAR
jgi:hypothetical protein